MRDICAAGRNVRPIGLICFLCMLLALQTPMALAAVTLMDYDMDTAPETSFLQGEYDESGHVVSVRGYPVRMVRAGFNNRGQLGTFEYEIPFCDYPFWAPATEYSGDLAVMSLALALSANRSKLSTLLPVGTFDPSLTLERFLTDAGFQDIRKDDYSRATSMYTVSTAMGHRVMEHEGEEPFTLIAVGVCGGFYENEWESNI